MLKLSFKFLNSLKKIQPQAGSPENTPVDNTPQENTVSQYVQPQADPQAAAKAAVLARHKNILDYFDRLLKTGHDSATVQAQWQRYYSQLSDDDKQLIWQSADKQSQPQSQSSPTPAPQPNLPEPPATRSFSNLFGIPLSIKGYSKRSNSSSQPAQQAAVQPESADSDNKGKMAEVMPDTSLNYRARNMFTWNSPTALFDKEESRSIWRQNFKSVVFGLTVGAICLVVWQFTFFNEQYLLPFIQPASSTTDSQIIITPGEVAISDPAFKLIIPKLNLEAPIVDGIGGFRAINEEEPERAFEKRVQEGLKSGTIHYPGTQYPGESGRNFNSNVVVLGHSSSNIFAPGSFKSVFSKLGDMELGDLVLTNYKNKQYIYKIYEKKVVKPQEISVLQAGRVNNTLTLITCHPPGDIRHRLVLLAEQINPDPFINESVEQNADFNSRETVVPGKSQSAVDVFFR